LVNQEAKRRNWGMHFTFSLIFEFGTLAAFYTRFLQIANGIGFLHRNAIYHRNINPQNILVCGLGVWKLAGFNYSCRDFGENAIQAPRFSSDVRYQWNSYRPPHIEAEKTHFDKWDVYSFAIIIGETYLAWKDPKYYKQHWTLGKNDLLGVHNTEFRPFNVPEDLSSSSEQSMACPCSNSHALPSEETTKELTKAITGWWVTPSEERPTMDKIEEWLLQQLRSSEILVIKS